MAEFLRDGWQEELKTLRNEHLEHRDEDVAAQAGKFYEPAWPKQHSSMHGGLPLS